MARLTLAEAYPGITFRPRTYNWWARLTRVPAECVHLETDPAWTATFIPDTLYLRGRPSSQRDPRRPEVSLCRSCLLGILKQDLAARSETVVAFEPDLETFSQYFFVAERDFAAAGLQPETADAITARLGRLAGACERCSRPASWLWLPRQEVPSLDDTGRICDAPGRRLCAPHGAEALSTALAAGAEANLFYINVPYGGSGAYLWI